MAFMRAPTHKGIPRNKQVRQTGRRGSCKNKCGHVCQAFKVRGEKLTFLGGRGGGWQKVATVLG